MMAKNNRPSRSRRWANQRRYRNYKSNANRVPKPYCTPIWVGNKVVGEVYRDVFLKRVKASRHFLRKPPAISFGVDTLEQAQQAGAILVHILDLETGKSYRALLSTIWEKGFVLDRGHGRQIALPLSCWGLGEEPLAKQTKLWGSS